MTGDQPADKRDAGPAGRGAFPTPASRIGGVKELSELFWKPTREGLHVTGSHVPPPGYRTEESYAIVPNARNPRYLLPLASRRLASDSVALYRALSERSRSLARRAAAAGLRGGVAQPFLRDRLYVHVPERFDDKELAHASVMHHVARELDAERLIGFVGLGGAGQYAKPVIQLISENGQPAAFVKVGWNEATVSLVKNEARALQRCAEKGLLSLRVPRSLYSGRWDGLELSVASPLPMDVRRYPADELPPLRTTYEICSLGGGDRQPVWQGLFADSVQELADRSSLHGTLTGLRERYSDARLRIGAWHGDWVPWNLATRGAELHVWDWEYSGDLVPLGFDVLHFFFQSAFVRNQQSLVTSIRTCRSAATEPLSQLGLTSDSVDLVLVLYLLEICSRAEQGERFGNLPNPRLHPEIRRLLEQPSAILAL